MSAVNNSVVAMEMMQGLRILRAYTGYSDEIQEGIRDMLAIVFDKEADADDRAMAMHALADALYPNLHEGQLGLDLERSESMGAQHSQETRDVLAEMDQEEAVFAQTLGAIMSERGLTQVAFAEMSGVGQPAISNMLNRQCRPQRRTILRFAEALKIDPAQLWPGFQK